MPNRSTALITGASSGIGRALALLFARDGYDVVLVARRVDALESLAAEIAGLTTVSARVVPVDLAMPSGPQAVFDELQRNGVAVDALVNNAGFGLQGSFIQQPIQ